MSLYPLKFKPRLVEKMWGGRKLESVLGKALPPGKAIGESWELYDFPPGVVDGSKDWVSSEIANGPLAGRTLHWAMGEFGRDVLGDVPPAGQGQFPLLVKFLDAREDLSVQVHPDEAYARANPGAHLKSEAWYVLQSDPGARLLKGLRPGTTRRQFEQAVERGEVERLIRAVPAKEDACFYLPSGTVHALGAGLLVAEVQTPSDTTFRVFDFNRIDPSIGKPRTLHVRQALDCIDFGDDPEPVCTPPADGPLVDSPYFAMNRVQLGANQSRALDGAGPLVLIAVHGTAELSAAGSESVTLARGDVWLLPAAIDDALVRASSPATLLQVSFPRRFTPRAYGVQSVGSESNRC